MTGAWNPFRITGTPMPPSLLLLCKLLALAILATRHFLILPDPFLPFLPFLDELPGEPFRLTLQVVVVAAALALLFNRSVRASALVLGGAMLLAVISSKAYYGNNKTFVGLLLVLAGLSDFDRPAYLVRWQLSLTYLGAALNKLLDPDWQSGLFFDFWGHQKVQNPVFQTMRDLLPPLLAGQFMCWLTIVVELFIAVALFVPRLVMPALWLNALFQIGLLMFTGGTFTLFFYAMNAAALAFLSWPETIPVSCPPSRLPRWGWLRWLDVDGLQAWRVDPGVTALHWEAPAARYSGLGAALRLLLFTPIFWFLLTAALAFLPSAESRRILVGAALALILLASWPDRRFTPRT